mmetsp:Transcript_1244/g.2599  ORF Transcript_1244/g.2599 Transcript_1244/m.2599 type:complete len:193 (-) Transcript_1244:112-690(-)
MPMYALASIGFVEDWRRLNVAITRAKHALIMVGSARTLGSGEAGEAASDLIRAAAVAGAILTSKENTTPAMDLALAASLAAPASGSGTLKRRRAAPPEVPVQLTVPEANVRDALMMPRSVRAVAQPRRVEVTVESDAYLLARAKEIEAYVEACKREDAAKAAKKQEGVQAARADFAPPLFNSREGDADAGVL